MVKKNDIKIKVILENNGEVVESSETIDLISLAALNRMLKHRKKNSNISNISITEVLLQYAVLDYLSHYE